MKTTPRALMFGRMLDLCDDLQRIRSRISDPATSHEERERLRRQSQRRQDRLARQLAAYRGRGPLATQLRKHRLDAAEFEVLAVLLQRAVRAEEPEMEGRLILGSIFDTSFGVLSGMHLLQEDARLRTSGLVRVAHDQPIGTDVLETRFRLSEQALAAMREEVVGRRTVRRAQSPLDGYRSQRELLLDLRLLHNHYRRRSDLVFDPARWEGLQAGAADVAADLSRRIDDLWGEVRTRIMRTELQDGIPLLRLLRDHRLGDAETMIVVHLLFRELHSGEAFADVADLLRLVAASESGLLRARSLVAAEAPLLRHGVLVLEPFVENRELTAEAHLADWVVRQVLSAEDAQGIKADDRLRWHEYLDRLDSSDGFYRDLDA